MRSLLHKAAAISATASLVFFWSCERHEPGELPDHSAHGKAGEGHHGAGADHGHAHDKKKSDGHGDAGHRDDNPNPADGGMAQEGTGTPPPGSKVEDPHLSGQAIPPVASPAGTPAQFFPSPTPR